MCAERIRIIDAASKNHHVAMKFFFGAGRPLLFLFLAIACCLRLNVFAAEESRPPLTPAAAAARGEPLYRQHCAACHSHPTERIPPRLRFLTMTPHTVFDAMTTGIMKSQAAGLTEEDRRTLAVVLSYQSFEESPNPPELNLCAKAGGPLDFGAQQWNGWGRVPENSRFQPAPSISAADVPRLKLKWAYAYPKSAGKSNGQPTVIGNRVFVTSEAGKGSCFEIYLPCIDTPFTPARPSCANSGSACKGQDHPGGGRHF